MAEVRTYRLPLPPSANAYWQTGALRSRRYGGGKMPLTQKAANFRQDVAMAILQARGRFNDPLPPLRGLLKIEVRIVWANGRWRDSGNVAKQLEDALEKSGVYENDRQIVDHRYWVDLTEAPNGTGYVDVVLTQIGNADDVPARTVKRRLPVGRKAVTRGR